MGKKAVTFLTEYASSVKDSIVWNNNIRGTEVSSVLWLLYARSKDLNTWN